MEPPQNDSTTPVVTQTQSKKRSRAETDAPEPEDLAVPFTLPPIREILSAEPRLSPERVHQQQLTRDANSSRAPSLEPSNSTTGPPSVTGNESTTTLSSSETDTAYYSESLPSLSTGAHRSISPAHVFSSMSGHPDSLAEATDDDGEYETDLEEQAAVAQAEEGSIIVDSDDLSSDGGYGTDTGSTGSTSLAESMRDFIYENGRRYHRFREGRYNFPNDDVEYVLSSGLIDLWMIR